MVCWQRTKARLQLPEDWRDRPADEAMANARTLVDAHARADFTKIHFDCSEGCAGEAVQVGDAVSAGRAGELATVWHRAASDPGSLS